MVIILDHARDGNGKAEFSEDVQGDVHLPAAAVHEDKVREAREFRELLITAGFPLFLPADESARQNFVHAGIIIRPGHGFDRKFAIITPFWLSLLEYDHGSDVCKSGYVGNIVGLHPVRRREMEPFRDFLRGADRAAFLPLQPFAVLRKDKLCILLCEGDQFFLLTALRNEE